MMGGIGAIFTFLGVASTISSIFLNGYSSSTSLNLSAVLVTGVVGLFAFIGFIMFLIAMSGFSKDYGDHRIFNYIIYGIVGTIIAAVVAAVILFGVLLLNLSSIIPSTTSTSAMPIFVSPYVAVGALAGLVWVVFIVKAFNLLGKKSEVSLFRTAAFLLLAGVAIGVVLDIVFATLAYFGSINYSNYLLAGIPGSLIQNFAWALLAIAFFRIKVPPTTQTFTQPNFPPIAGQVKYCSNCRTPNQNDAIYCTHCGQNLA